MHIIAFGQSEVGKVRANNEDSYLVDDELSLYAVADGIGGHQGGEVASRMAIQSLARITRQRLSREDEAAGNARAAETAGAALGRAVSCANTLIIDASAQTPHLAGMGTTLTTLLLSGRTAFIAHVGDSRAYLLRDGSLQQITRDHSIVGEQVRAGLLTSEQAKTNPYRHIITRSLGAERDLIVDQQEIAVRQDDVFLLCTDGLTEMVEDRDIQPVLAGFSPSEAAAKLIESANERGGVDNITVVVVKIGRMG